MVVAQMLRLNLRFAVKFRVSVTEQSANGAVILMAHNAVAGSNAHFGARGSRCESQCGGAVLGGSVHSQVLGVHILLPGRGRNLRRRGPVQCLPVCGHANRDPCHRPHGYGGRAGEGADICIVHGVYINIGSIVRFVEIRVQNFGRSFPFDGVKVYRTGKLNAEAAGSRQAAGRQLGNDGVGGGTVHHDAGLVFRFAVFAELLPVCGNIQFFRFKEVVILRPGNSNVPRVRSRYRAALYQRVGTAGNLVDGNCRPDAHFSGGGDVEAPGEVVETVVASRHYAHAAIGGEVLIFDDGIHIVTNVIVAAGTAKGTLSLYGNG